MSHWIRAPVPSAAGGAGSCTGGRRWRVGGGATAKTPLPAPAAPVRRPARHGAPLRAPDCRRSRRALAEKAGRGAAGEGAGSADAELWGKGEVGRGGRGTPRRDPPGGHGSRRTPSLRRGGTPGSQKTHREASPCSQCRPAAAEARCRNPRGRGDVGGPALLPSAGGRSDLVSVTIAGEKNNVAVMNLPPWPSRGRGGAGGQGTAGRAQRRRDRFSDGVVAPVSFSLLRRRRWDGAAEPRPPRHGSAPAASATEAKDVGRRRGDRTLGMSRSWPAPWLNPVSALAGRPGRYRRRPPGHAHRTGPGSRRKGRRQRDGNDAPRRVDGVTASAVWREAARAPRRATAPARRRSAQAGTLLTERGVPAGGEGGRRRRDPASARRHPPALEGPARSPASWGAGGSEEAAGVGAGADGEIGTRARCPGSTADGAEWRVLG